MSDPGGERAPFLANGADYREYAADTNTVAARGPCQGILLVIPGGRGLSMPRARTMGRTL